MVFRRREKRTFIKFLWEVMLSFKGLTRAIEYVKIRLKRIPDTPHKISLGVSCGVFASFTPFFGIHFLIAGLLSYLIRGNVLASLIGTFVGNPISFPFITVLNLKLGELLIGKNDYADEDGVKVFESFVDIIFLYYKKIFTDASFIEHDTPRANEFISNVFLPYSIGGLILGGMSAIISYFLFRPLIRTYQKRRKIRRIRKQRKRLRRQNDEIK
jgi:hypothetical protein